MHAHTQPHTYTPISHIYHICTYVHIYTPTCMHTYILRHRAQTYTYITHTHTHNLKEFGVLRLSVLHIEKHGIQVLFLQKLMKVSFSDVGRSFFLLGLKGGFSPTCFVWAPRSASRRNFDPVNPLGAGRSSLLESRKT